MLTITDAQKRILDALKPLPTVSLPLEEAHGLTLAEHVYADEPVPAFANSAMDGYALRAEDVRGASLDHPVYLNVVGEQLAGSQHVFVVQPGEAVRIHTGAPVPDGANAVIMRESGIPAGQMVGVTEPVRRGMHIRPAGNDVGAGTLVLPRQSVLLPASLGMLAALGRTSVRVFRRARVAVLSTGDELVSPGRRLRPGEIYDSNSVSLQAQVEEAGGTVVHKARVRDQAGALESALNELPECDAIISSGGVSVGDFDFVKNVLGRNGEVDFWRIAIKPGRPMAFGHYRGIPFFGLPGNPVSSFVTFEVFVRPAIRKLMGRADPFRPVIRAALTAGVRHETGRREYMRGTLVFGPKGPLATVRGDQDSAVLSALAQANALIIVPEDVASLRAGANVDVLWSGEAALE